MDLDSLRLCLAGSPVKEIKFYPSIGSTNDVALEWAQQGAPDFALVVADHQTSGRGRLGRRWITSPSSALAFSLILRPHKIEEAQIALFTALGALAVCQAIDGLGFPPSLASIKWPNDVLLERKKTAGILVESSWLGMQIDCVVIGIGVNITPSSVPPANEVLFPATSIETALRHPINRLSFLGSILENIALWRTELSSPHFHQAWNERLAFKGEMVSISTSQEESIQGHLQGIARDGCLILRLVDGTTQLFRFGEIHLRPVNSTN